MAEQLWRPRKCRRTSALLRTRTTAFLEERDDGLTRSAVGNWSGNAKCSQIFFTFFTLKSDTHVIVVLINQYISYNKQISAAVDRPAQLFALRPPLVHSVDGQCDKLVADRHQFITTHGLCPPKFINRLRDFTTPLS